MSVVPGATVISCKKRTDQLPLDLAMEVALVTLMVGLECQEQKTEVNRMWEHSSRADYSVTLRTYNRERAEMRKMLIQGLPEIWSVRRGQLWPEDTVTSMEGGNWWWKTECTGEGVVLNGRKSTLSYKTKELNVGLVKIMEKRVDRLERS